MISRSTDVRSALRSRQRGFLLSPARFGQAPAGDPSYSSVSILLHGDGANGSTSITDNSPSPKTVSRFGNAQIRTTQSKFGGASISLDGAGDYLSVPNSSAFDMGSGNFTVEGFYRPTSFAAFLVITAKRASGSFFSPFILQFGASDIGNSAKITFLCSVTGTSWAFSLLSSSLSAGVWVHFAAVRNGANATLYIDGTSVGTSSALGVSALMTNSNALTIGADGNGTEGLNGYLDEFRITKGVARYTANFTPPTAAFPNSA